MHTEDRTLLIGLQSIIFSKSWWEGALAPISEGPKKTQIIWIPSNWNSGSPLLGTGECIRPCPSSIWYYWSWYLFGHMQGLWIIDTVLYWFCSFLNQPLLSVFLRDERLKPCILQSGVPQSSVYFPELFHINKSCSGRSSINLELVIIRMLMRSSSISVHQAKQGMAIEVLAPVPSSCEC